MITTALGRRRPEHPPACRANPPDRTITDDDIVILDFGPIFDGYETDFGRTFVLVDNPVKLCLQADLPRLFATGRAFFAERPDITCAQLSAHVRMLAAEAGWKYGSEHAGHLVGEFPHTMVHGERAESYIRPGSAGPMRRNEAAEHTCHWILEINLFDRQRGFASFDEQLLTLR